MFARWICLADVNGISNSSVHSFNKPADTINKPTSSEARGSRVILHLFRLPSSPYSSSVYYSTVLFLFFRPLSTRQHLVFFSNMTRMICGNIGLRGKFPNIELVSNSRYSQGNKISNLDDYLFRFFRFLATNRYRPGKIRSTKSPAIYQTRSNYRRLIVTF